MTKYCTFIFLIFALLIINISSLINLQFIRSSLLDQRNKLHLYYHNKNKVSNEDNNIDVFNVVASKYEKNLDGLYEKSLKIKCPFFRRRAFDTIESLKRILYFLIARHKSITFFPISNAKATDLIKTYDLTIDELVCIINKDWIGSNSLANGKGYYITGRISKDIYDEQCYFDGPDPDMPVKGLRKYLLSVSQLFDHKYSRADLLKPLEVDYEMRTIKAYWRLEGILNLPWHPTVKPWTGNTTYYIDDHGLVYKHIEEWDIPVLDAFISTLFPWLNYGAPAALPSTFNSNIL